MKTMTIEQVLDELVEMGIATESELELVANINGYNIETLNSVVYARTGYHSLEQLIESEEEEELND
jgi:hypothetical protein